MLRHVFHFEGVAATSHEGIEARVRAWVERHLAPVLDGFGLAEATLSAVVKRHSRRGGVYCVRFHLHLPRRKVLVSRAESGDLRQAIDTALDRLLREVDRHVDRLRHQGDYKRKTRRRRLRMLKRRLAEMPAERVAEATAGLEPLLGRLEAVARREVAFLRATGDLPPDYPQVEDLVAEAVAAIKADWRSETDSELVFRRLLKALYEAIDREIASSRLYGDMVSLEAPEPPDAEDQAEAMVEEEIHEFWQPDEVVQLQDVIADEGLMEEGDDETRQVYRLQLMEALPEIWRRALMLHEFEGFDRAALAEVFDVTPDTVGEWLDHAGHFLEAHLIQAGLVVRHRAEGGDR